jgi:hypothetical protein
MTWLAGVRSMDGAPGATTTGPAMMNHRRRDCGTP